MISHEDLINRLTAERDCYRELVLQAAVSIARSRYGKSLHPVRVEIGGYAFRVIGGSAELVS